MSPKLRLNLGCGSQTYPSMRNVDVVDAYGVDEVVDLDEMPWPWHDDEAAYVLMDNSLEHLLDPHAVILEVMRVLEPGGVFEVMVPHRDAPHACIPTHRSYWTPRSMDPYLVGADGNKRGHQCIPGFRLKSVDVRHRSPGAWHQRVWLGRELVAWGPNEIHWRLRRTEGHGRSGDAEIIAEVVQ